MAQTEPGPAAAASPTPVTASSASGGGVTISAATGQIISSPGIQPAATNASVANALTNARAGLGRLGTNNPTAARSKITPVQLQNINQLALQLNGLALPNRDATDQQRGVTEILQAAPIGNSRPSADAVTKLGASLTSVLPNVNLTAQQRRQLAIDLNLALNSGSLSATEAQRVIADARSLLQGGTVNRPGVTQLMESLEGIVAQLQRGNDRAGLAADQGTNAPYATPAAPEAGQSGGSQSGEGSGSSGPASSPRAP